MADLSKAAQDILAERQRQIDQEGWTPAHDDAHRHGEMARAANCYSWIAAQSEGIRTAFRLSTPPTWPADWSPEWWKPTDRRRDLVKAGALILAEIERLDRKEADQ